MSTRDRKRSDSYERKHLKRERSREKEIKKDSSSTKDRDKDKKGIYYIDYFRKEKSMV